MIPLHQLHGRTCSYLHPASPDLLSHVLKQQHRSEVLIHPCHHSSTATPWLVSRMQLLLHLILYHTPLYLLYQTVLSHQGGGFPPFHLGIHIQQLCRLPGLACFPSTSHGFQRPCWQPLLLLLCQGHLPAKLQHTLTALLAFAALIVKL